MSRVAVYTVHGGKRAHAICTALAEGATAARDRVQVIDESKYSSPDHDVAAFYGLHGNLARILREYVASGKKAVYVDLGYWGRVNPEDKWCGYHKVVVNARHPNEYFQKHKHAPDRIDAHRVRVDGWKEGKHILIAGMGQKAAQAEGYKPEEWERWAIAEIRKHTDRPIVYRPKPSWLFAKPIHEVGYSHHNEPVEAALRGCHAVVTHHSNVAVEALAMGIPAFAWGGVAVPMSLQDLSRIEAPYRPTGRRQWLADIAYCQWSVPEIASGRTWMHLKGEGLIP